MKNTKNKRGTRRKCCMCKKMFTVKFDTKTVHQKMCSCKCAVVYYTKLKPKSRKLAREVSKEVGRRSMAEVKFDAANIEGRAQIMASYEADTFEYDVIETHKYTPDWTIVTDQCHFVYIEFKGVLDGATRKKMKLVKAQYPATDIRFVFEKASNKIYKGSKTTYGMWADKHGFPWADNTLPKEWLK